MRGEKWLLIDCCGALLSAIATGIVLPLVHMYIGMPVGILRVLGILAVCYAGFGFLSWKYFRSSWVSFLSTLVLLNVIYCLTIIMLMIWQGDTVLLAGHLYFWIECLVLILLIYFEVRAIRKQRASAADDSSEVWLDDNW